MHQKVSFELQILLTGRLAFVFSERVSQSSGGQRHAEVELSTLAGGASQTPPLGTQAQGLPGHPPRGN